MMGCYRIATDGFSCDPNDELEPGEFGGLFSKDDKIEELEDELEAMTEQRDAWKAAALALKSGRYAGSLLKVARELEEG
jgi:hypothetical protein